MFSKVIKYTFFVGLGIVVFAFGASLVAGYFMGRDIDHVSVDSATAARDAEGIWQINAIDRPTLWKTFGYLQAHDRYFQIELVRHAALGRLSEIMGEKVLGRDRLGRVLASVAYKKFKKLPNDSIVKQSANHFVQGVQAWRKSESASDPVEFQFLGLESSALSDWEPWHVYAISFYQAWMFSYDLLDENRDDELRQVKGDVWSKFFDTKEVSSDKNYLYSHDTIKNHLRKPHAGFSATAFSRMMPAPSEINELNALFGIEGDAKVTRHFGRIPVDVQLGASNAWVGYHPKRQLGPILCNDPHLQLTWPSSLYPIKYTVSDGASGEIRGDGWMLPGQPFLATGALENRDKMYAWGVTLANYANVQDRIPLNTSDLKSASAFTAKFKVRDPRTYRESVVSFEEKWTPWGPVGSDWFEHDPKQTEEWAIDWIGFRGAEPPYQYLIEKNFDLSVETSKKVAADWHTPVLNMHWIAKDKPSGHSSWGHMVAGMIYSSKATKALQRMGISTPKDREYYASNSTENDVAFLASGNQQVWSRSESERYAEQWSSPLRAQRIFDKREENFNQLGFSQTDDHSLLSHAFVKWARRRLSANKLCVDGTGADGFFSRCQLDLSQLDAWGGAMEQSDWRPSLVSLWIAELKWRLWIVKDASSRGPELANRSEREINLFVKWGRSAVAQKLVWEVVHNPQFGERLKNAFHLDLDTLVKSSFSDAYAMFENTMGLDRTLWSWSNLHRVAWQHPLLSMLGPNLPFVGPPMSGTDDSPLRASSEWDPRFPMLFPVVHGAVARSCYDATGDHLKVQTTAVSGPSGNPFSNWSQTFSKNYYFAHKWYEDKFFRRTSKSD